MPKIEIKKDSLPHDTMLSLEQVRWHYQDVYATKIHDPERRIHALELGRSFFSSGPKWIAVLFAFRNKLVKLVGLKTPEDQSNREKALAAFKAQPGEKMGLFRVLQANEQELILGEDDRHLNFRVSLYISEAQTESDDRKLIVSTTVFYHNRFGRFYFAIVKPFHRLIVPSMLRGMVEDLQDISKETN